VKGGDCQLDPLCDNPASRQIPAVIVAECQHRNPVHYRYQAGNSRQILWGLCEGQPPDGKPWVCWQHYRERVRVEKFYSQLHGERTPGSLKQRTYAARQKRYREWASQHRAGMPMSDIAELHGVHPATVSRGIAVMAGRKRGQKTQKQVTVERRSQHQQIVALRQQGLLLREIADQVGVHLATASAVLRKAGLTTPRS
jgi:transposase